MLKKADPLYNCRMQGLSPSTSKKMLESLGGLPLKKLTFCAKVGILIHMYVHYSQCGGVCLKRHKYLFIFTKKLLSSYLRA